MVASLASIFIHAWGVSVESLRSPPGKKQEGKEKKRKKETKEKRKKKRKDKERMKEKIL